MYDLCICLKCKECNGIYVTKLKGNLFVCNTTKNLLYKFDNTSFIHIEALNQKKWIKYVTGKEI